MTTKNNTQSKGWGYRVACLALGLVVGAGVAMGVSAACGVFSSDETNVEAENSSSGFAVGDTESHGISLSTVAVQGSGTFNSKTYESSATISATVTPSDATDLTLTWSLAWASTSSAIISDYVALSSTTSSSGESITVYCYKPFSTQIILTAKADAGLTSDVTATATLDYYKGVSAIVYDSIYSSTSTPTITSSTTFSAVSSRLLSATYSTGTLTESFTNLSIVVTFTEDSGLRNQYSTYSYTLGDGSNYDYSIDYLYLCLMMGVLDGNGVYPANKDGIGSVIYSDCLSLYNSSIPVFNFEISFEGSVSGKEYSFNIPVLLDPSGFYTEATGVTLGDTNLYF